MLSLVNQPFTWLTEGYQIISVDFDEGKLKYCSSIEFFSCLGVLLLCTVTFLLGLYGAAVLSIIWTYHWT